MASPEDLANWQQADLQLSIQMDFAYLEAITALVNQKTIVLPDENLLHHYSQRLIHLQQDLQSTFLKEKIAADYNIQIQELLKAIKDTLENSGLKAKLINRYFDNKLTKFLETRRETPLFEDSTTEDDLVEAIKILINNTQTHSEAKMNYILLKLNILRELRSIDMIQQSISLNQSQLKAIGSRLFESALTILEVLGQLAKTKLSLNAPDHSLNIIKILNPYQISMNRILNNLELTRESKRPAWVKILKEIDMSTEAYQNSSQRSLVINFIKKLNLEYLNIFLTSLDAKDKSSRLSIPVNLTEINLKTCLEKVKSELNKRRQKKEQFTSFEASLKTSLQLSNLQISNEPNTSNLVTGGLACLVGMARPQPARLKKKFKGNPQAEPAQQESMQVENDWLESLQQMPQRANFKSNLHKLMTEEFFNFIHFNFEGLRSSFLFTLPGTLMNMWTNHLRIKLLVGEITKQASDEMILKFESISRSFFEKRIQGKNVRIMDEQEAQDFINGEALFNNLNLALEKQARKATLLMQEEMINAEIHNARMIPLVAH
jgi:hypothetical protein